MTGGSSRRAGVVRGIQRRLVDLYDITDSPPVDAFLCDAAAVEAAGADPSRGEVLLVREETHDAFVGLYVAPGALDVLAKSGPVLSPERFSAWCLAAEGVSHFVCLNFRHAAGSSVSQLELEVQAEVDKWAVALLATDLGPQQLLAGNGVGLFLSRSRAIRRELFERQQLIDTPGSAAHARYHRATESARRTSEELEQEFVGRGDTKGLVTELRRFYRASPSAKLSRD